MGIKAWARVCLPLLAVCAAGLFALGPAKASADTGQVDQSVGVQGTIAGPAPAQAPTVGVPHNGQVFTNTPITVSGLCQSGLLVEIFSNNVFAGSTECSGGSFSLQIDLFSGRNDLVARQYDALNQASPDSATVTVTFDNTINPGASLISLITQYSKRGADPGDALTWPLSISGGTGPYAISVDWGDSSAAELVSLSGPGSFNIQHIYQQAGTYKVTVEATDVNGASAFLQLVGVGNGATQQSGSSQGAAGSANQGSVTQEKVIWWPYAVLFVLAISTFWLGKKHQLEIIRSRLRRGERPFK